MKTRRVVVTGLGILTPVGNSVSDFWNAIISGTSGAASITRFDASKFKTQFACEIKNFKIEDHLDRKEARKMDAFSQYAMVTAHQAFLDSGIDITKVDLDKCGVIFGSGIGGLDTFMVEISAFAKGNGTPRFNPFFIPKAIPDIAPGHISIRYGFRGVNFTIASACASSTHAMIDAANYIRLNHADIIIAGGSEAAVNEAGIGGFNAMHALSVRNDSPQTASRPFDKDRDGFVLGEGSGSIILEEMEHALARGAKIYAEFAGGGMSADAHHITAPHSEGLGAINVMRNALRDGIMKPEEIDYINVHGTSTPLGDISESKAILNVFGEHADNVNISSTKSMTGHLLGAAGVTEAIACILAMNNNCIPPTINHFTNDPEFDIRLNFTFNKAQHRTVNVVMSNTFGFGGHNASVIFKKFEGK
ncbi:MAG: beta-ketoacyl-ACP synthase II [Bacteroidota bacterium]